MSSYSRWDRAAYIKRVGGQGEAERRREALMVERRELATLDASLLQRPGEWSLGNDPTVGAGGFEPPASRL